MDMDKFRYENMLAAEKRAVDSIDFTGAKTRTCNECNDEFLPERQRQRLCEMCEFRERQIAEGEAANQECRRALVMVAACQRYKIAIPEIPYTHLALSQISGRNNEVVEICQKFINEVKPLVAAAEAR